MSQKDLDKLFRDALGEGRAQPRPDSWARVAAGLPSAAANGRAKPKRRVLWFRYAAVASLALAAAGLWWARPSETTPNLSVAATSLAHEATPRQEASSPQLAATAPSPRRSSVGTAPERLVGANPAALSPAKAMPNKFGSVRAELAFLERMSPVDFDERVPLIPVRERPAEAAAYAANSETPRRRYAQLASNLQDVWSLVRSIRESEASPQVHVEVHVPAAVLQRLNQTKELAENLTESWSTFQSKHSH
ncbi:MAG: hypothetical protein RL485_828 [Bacteroidota bacterium]